MAAVADGEGEGVVVEREEVPVADFRGDREGKVQRGTWVESVPDDPNLRVELVDEEDAGDEEEEEEDRGSNYILIDTFQGAMQLH